MRAAVRVRDGLWWVASNSDLTIPTAFGVAPGHGVLVETLRRFSGVEPVVAGKPSRPLLDETVRRVGGDRPLMVGDRLDTDIEGRGQRRDRLAARPHRRDRAARAGGGAAGGAADVPRPSTSADCPTAHPEVALREGTATCGGWTAGCHDGRLTVTGAGAADDWWRVVARGRLGLRGRVRAACRHRRPAAAAIASGHV